MQHRFRVVALRGAGDALRCRGLLRLQLFVFACVCSARLYGLWEAPGSGSSKQDTSVCANRLEIKEPRQHLLRPSPVRSREAQGNATGGAHRGSLSPTKP